MKRSHSLVGWVLLASIGYPQSAIIPWIGVANAQVTPDGTVGTIVSTGPVFNITGGTRPSNGPNLFHSFSQFSLPTGSSAIFQNNPAVQTIFSRVTGGSRSDIDGTIQARGNASLFLMNPNGILFGPNAKLQLGGSFVGTTANSIQFEDGIGFSTENLTANPLLTVNLPIGLQMGQNPAAIAVKGSILTMLSGRTLSLMGGDLQIQGGRLVVPGGRIELGSLAQAGTVAIAPSTLAATYTGLQTFGTVDLSQGAVLNLNSTNNGGGSLNVQAGQLFLREGSRISSNTMSNNNSGNIVINADQFTIDRSTIGSSTLGGSGNAGDINIQVRTLQVLNGSLVEKKSTGSGSGGDLNITAQESIKVSGHIPNATALGSTTSGNGKGGRITVQTPDLLIDGGGRILMSTYGPADSGTVTVTTDRLRLDNTTGADVSGYIASLSADIATGNAGQVNVTTRTLQMFNGAYMGTSTFGSGNAGTVKIQATESMEMSGASPTSPTALYSGSNPATASRPASSGNSGTIWVETPSLIMRDRSMMRAILIGSGKAGNIIIKADTIDAQNSSLIAENTGDLTSQAGLLDITAHQVRLDASRITTQTLGKGDANPITMKVQNLQLLNRSIITAQTTNAGNASNIDISANTLTVQNSDITSKSTATGNAGRIDLTIANQFTANNGILSTRNHDGVGGSIQMTAQQVQLQNNSLIDSSTTGKGNAGAVEVNANAITLRQSTISSQSTGIGDGGTLKLVTGSLGLVDGALLSTAASNAGQAGDLTIAATDGVTLQNDSQITSRSTGSGLGGTIDITSRSLQLDQNSQINASTVSSDGGNLILNVMDLVRLNDRSLLNAEAGGLGNGGTIKINARFVTGFRDSDIIANAVRGKGGTVEITTQGIFGLAYRPQRTPDNDITASSQYGINGTVQLNTLNINPASALNALPGNVAQPTQLDDRCAAAKTGSFVSTGRGGIPRNPMQTQKSDRTWQDLREIESDRSPLTTVTTPIIQNPTAIVEASALQTHFDGSIELVTPTASAIASGATCSLSSLTRSQ